MPVEIPQFVQEWFTRLDSRSLSNVVPGPDCAAIVSVDMVVGFCQAGSLASERLGALIPPTALCSRVRDVPEKANALNLDAFRVIVPAETVDTYDLPTHVAHERQIYPHPGDFFHHVLLDHLALNGIEVYGKLT